MLNKPTIDEILAPKPEARPRIYAYSIADEAHKGKAVSAVLDRRDAGPTSRAELPHRCC